MTADGRAKVPGLNSEKGGIEQKEMGAEGAYLERVGRGKGKKIAISRAERNSKYREKKKALDEAAWKERCNNYSKKCNQSEDKKNELKKNNCEQKAMKRLEKQINMKEELPNRYIQDQGCPWESCFQGGKGSS